MLEIQVDRNDGKGWVFPTYDTTPNYTEAICRVGDALAGQWSNAVEIVAGG